MKQEIQDLLLIDVRNLKERVRLLEFHQEIPGQDFEKIMNALQAVNESIKGKEEILHG
jgi:hypothetical protein